MEKSVRVKEAGPVSKKPQAKGSSWVVSSFADFGLSSSPPSGGKMFKRPREPGGRSGRTQKQQRSAQTLQGRSVLWVDLYAPSTREDLAVHKKKVQEVESWLVESASGMKGRKLLLLTGPSGCGKSATVRVLAKEAGLNLLEWTNPTTTPYNNTFMEAEDNNTWQPGDTVVPVSQTTQFWEFLMRCSKYNSVCNVGKAGNLVCVEDFPNAVLRDPPSFHAMLRKYTHWSNSSPLVFIVTDSTKQYGSVKHLFPPDLQQQLSIVNISFNPIASSLLVKALTRILSVEGASDGGSRHPQPTKEVLQTLAETSGGDVRSAINALQFATKKDAGNIEGLFSGVSKKERSVGRAKSTKSKAPSTEEALVAVGGKDASLFLFRALGKVLYCKRAADRGLTEPLPRHLKEHERLPLQEVPESIYEKTSMGASSFSLFLHQNYLAFFSDIDSVAKAVHYLSDTDVLSAYWMERDVLEGYSTSITARGLMHPNKGGGSGGGWRPLTRPQWYTVTKQMQQYSSALKVEHCKHALTTEELVTDLVPLKCKILPGSSHTIQEVGRLSKTRRVIYTERLGELDATNTITEEEEEEERTGATLTSLPELPEASTSSAQTEEDLEDEELTIEDPDED